MNYKKLKKANKKTVKSILNLLPVILSILLLVSIVNQMIPKSFYIKIFTGNIILDALKGSLLGSILTGNPVTGYILGDGFLKNGVSLVAVTSFIVAWTTVGIIQLPAESIALGKRFAIYRNISAFIMAIIVAIISVLLINFL
jgi:uncharacterized membrane protein YraQ (UPF0718 family)